METDKTGKGAGGLPVYWGRGGGEMARRDEVRAPLRKGRRIAGC